MSQRELDGLVNFKCMICSVSRTTSEDQNADITLWLIYCSTFNCEKVDVVHFLSEDLELYA